MVDSLHFLEYAARVADYQPFFVSLGPPPDRFDMLKYIENYALPSLYTIDAKMKGNIGRFFNHSCEPNIRTQHVFVDTHDLRLPWIAFFTKTRVMAGKVSAALLQMFSFWASNLISRLLRFGVHSIVVFFCEKG